MDDDAARRFARLERESDAHRARLERLVGELEHRTHGVTPRLLKPLAIVAAVAGALALAAFAWRRLRARLGLSGRA
ncbi:MAG TPA: hypothetical protein VHL80_12750 [Polyangia bacterium]|nr:hypothetical protein [Polyangia bacterium]